MNDMLIGLEYIEGAIDVVRLLIPLFFSRFVKKKWWKLTQFDEFKG